MTAAGTAQAQAGPRPAVTLSLLYEQAGLPARGLPPALAAAYGGDIGFADP